MGDVLGTLIWGLLAGIIIGPLARLVLPGKQNVSIVMTIVLGAVGAIVGGFAYEALGGSDTPGIDWIRLIVQVAVAAVAVLIYGGAKKSPSA
ncbi:MAG TPA: GlsB/YeaQ/YmgE family stress response membrane protein [Acidimicrobiia bacterium]|nr:GlsB/YeaQ/YmgE family stress response membrane protein [Acidimicrobiia bacterium]